MLYANSVNINSKIKEQYIDEVLPSICKDFGKRDRGESQENYGSTALCDIAVLQALSRRIHFGKFVAESKFQTETEKFVHLIRRKDQKGIEEAITNKAVEIKVVERIRLKAKTYGTDPSTARDGNGKINMDAVADMYEVR